MSFRSPTGLAESHLRQHACSSATLARLAGILLLLCPALALAEEHGEVAEQQTSTREARDEGQSSDRVFVDAEFGAGAAERSIGFASRQGHHRLETRVVPMLHSKLELGIANRAWVLAIGATYQTSVATTAYQYTVAGPGQVTDSRSHRFEGGVTVLWRFAADIGLGAGALLGYGLRSWYSVAELGEPAFTMHGPIARVRLQWSIGDRLMFWAEPEVQALLAITPSFSAEAQLERLGLAYGGQGGARVRVVGSLALDLSYRESRATFHSAMSSRLSDVERHLVLAAHVRWL